MQEACVHQHSNNKELEIYGQKLEAGDIIKEGDVYECAADIWRKCGAQLIGETLDGEVLVTIIRPLPIKTFGIN